jgi:uncharacterized paraquat-inducible protein A
VNVADRERAFMRAELARVGILLDETKPAISAKPEPAQIVAPDLAAIRAVLEPHAPPHHLEWLVASCQSVEHALTYQRPAAVVVLLCDDGARSDPDHKTGRCSRCSELLDRHDRSSITTTITPCAVDRDGNSGHHAEM